MSDQFNLLLTPEGSAIEACPCCGSNAQVYEIVSEDRATQKLVCCSNGERFGPQDGTNDDGCPLFMGTLGHHQPTIREAVKYWNEYAKSLTALQRKNRWQKVKASGARSHKSE